MRRVLHIITKGQWQQGDAIGAVTLAFEDRHKRRFKMTDDGGASFLLDLNTAVLLADGDGLVLDGGGVILVRAATEAVADIHCSNPEQTARIAWHIGNRHTPVQVLEGGVLRILDDHVLVDMVEGLGARTERHPAPFTPEPGAYSGKSHAQDQTHAH